MAAVFGRPQSKEREYLFIDGGCLRAAIKTMCKEVFGREDAYQPYIPGLLSGRAYDKIFYYDAVPGKRHDEAQAAYENRVQPDYERFAKIQALDRVHVALGQIVGPNRRQKGVDVRLAVDMMTHSFRGNISRATLLAGDADFAPLIRSLVGEGLHVTLWHSSQANDELKGAADSSRVFDFKSGYMALTKDGERSAFSGFGGSTGGFPPFGEIDLVEIHGHQFGGFWRNNTLTVWRGDSGGSWQSQNFMAFDEDLSTALQVFDAITAWGIAENGEKWIKR